MAHKFVPRLNDRDLIRAFEQAKKKHAEDKATIKFIDTFGQEISEEHLHEIAKLSGHAIRHAIIRIDNVTWQLSRSEDSENPRVDSIQISIEGKSPGYGARPNNKLLFLKADALIDQVLHQPLTTGVSSGKYAAIASHGTILEKMESVAAELIENTDRHRSALTVEHNKNERRREEHYDNLVAELRKNAEEEKLRLDAENSKRIAALDEKEKSLNELKKSLDDRNNTHVRREIRSSLLQLAKDRLDNFTISGTTRKQYISVNLACASGFIVLASASIYFGSQITTDPETKKYSAEAIALIIKSGSYAAAAIALGSWYLGWLNRWLQRIADAEFRLQQFRLDIERASWLAETVLEWNASSEEPFPELLTARLSSGLFQSSGSDADGPRTPASHLAEALLGSASSAKLRMGENELNFDRKGIQRLED